MLLDAVHGGVGALDESIAGSAILRVDGDAYARFDDKLAVADRDGLGDVGGHQAGDSFDVFLALRIHQQVEELIAAIAAHRIFIARVQ